MRIASGLSHELHARSFGRKGIASAVEPRWALASDLKLFALTFAGGFLFVSLYLA